MSLISKQDPHVFLTLKLDPTTVALELGFTRDVSKIGHWGTGDLELTLRATADFEKARPLIERAYQEN
jgi:predicted transport protein